MFRNIQWKIVIIYFLLVFLAMQIIGLYIINELEEYHRNNLNEYLQNQANFIELQIKDISLEGISDIQKVVDRWYEVNLYSQIREVYILDGERNVIASSETEAVGRPIGDVLNTELSILLLSFLTGERRGDIIKDEKGEADWMDYAFPVKNSVDKVERMIYLRAEMEQINETLSEVKTQI